MTVQVFDDIDRGDGRTITATFVVPGGDPTNPSDRRDPTAVTGTLRDPDGTETTPTVSKSSTGVYTMDVVCSKPLSWWARIQGTGAVTAVAIAELRVREDVFST